MLPIILSTLAGSVALGNGLQLQRRAIQTQAICTADFTWMENAEANSPCITAAEVDAVCNGGNWIVPALNYSTSYDNPDPARGTATFCTCSWVSYNLISACTVCQNPQFSSKVVQWTDYSANCLGKLSDKYFPSNITLPSGVSIPFWATYDPTQWYNGTFNVTGVKQIAGQSHPDVGGPGADKPQESGNIMSPVVGGVIGGSVFIAATVAIAFYLSDPQRRAPKPGLTHSINDKPHHTRSISDIAINSGPHRLSSTSLNQPASLTIMTHNQSVPPVAYFSPVVGKTQGSSPPSRQAESRSPTSLQDVVDPFTSPPSSVSSHIDETEAVYPVHDPPSAQLLTPLQMENQTA